MKVFKYITIFRKKFEDGKLSRSKSMVNKRALSIGFLFVAVIFCLSDYFMDYSNTDLKDNTLALQRYGNELQSNILSASKDTLIVQLERERLLRNIEERLVTYLYRLPDYGYVGALEPYLRYAPEILNQIPSAVPLERGEYRLSSKYGIRNHPIQGKEKTHFGIDLAAASGKYVYASASGTVVSVTYSKKGYGTHIVIKHRFGFETLYGHLKKVLVSKGQNIKQHELIGTVGTTGSSTGYHLHYEIMKNGKKIDPMYSLNLKQKIYQSLYVAQIKDGTAKEN